MLVRILLPNPKTLVREAGLRLGHQTDCPRNWLVCVGHQLPSCGTEPALLSHCHHQRLERRWGVSKWGWVGLALELKVGVAFGEG